MAQSNRHWPSMFKSKPCSAHHQWQHDNINPNSLVPNSCGSKAPYSSVAEERSPEPKPRWNPKPEQIRILEAIFNSGMVNPPREEIRRIRGQLQEYGQVGDANVFYWFQNRKSRSKHKNRHLQPSKQPAPAPTTPPPPAPSSSSSSSEKSSPGPDKVMALGGGTGVNVVVDALNSPTGSVNNKQTAPYFTSPATGEGHYSAPDQAPGFMLQVAAAGPAAFSHGYYLSSSDLATMAAMSSSSSSEGSTTTGMGHCTSLLHELMGGTPQGHLGKKEVDEKMKMTVHHHHHHQYGYLTTTTTTTTAATAAVASPSINETQGMLSTGGGVGPATGLRSTTTTVFINDVAVEVGAAPLNVREAFGDDAVLLHASGQPVLTNEWGVTLHALQHGASYYLVSLYSHVVQAHDN